MKLDFQFSKKLYTLTLDPLHRGKGSNVCLLEDAEHGVGLIKTLSLKVRDISASNHVKCIDMLVKNYFCG